MSLPKQAKKVFDGIIFDVYQWEQTLYDGSKATFEMLKRPGTLLVIPEKDGKICLADQEQPVKGSFISLLGGRQEDGETPLAGAQRELLEESGLVSDDWELLFEDRPYNKVDWTVYTYVARNCREVKKQNPDAGEKISVLELDFDEFIDAVLSERFCGHELVEKILRMKLDLQKMEAFKKKLLG